MGNCYGTAISPMSSYYPLWCLNDYIIDLEDRSNVQKSWASIAHHDILYNATSQPNSQSNSQSTSQLGSQSGSLPNTPQPASREVTPGQTVKHVNNAGSDGTGSTPASRGYHKYAVSQSVSTFQNEAIASKVSFPLFHERFLMRFIDLHPSSNTATITDTALLLQLINVLVNGLQQPDRVYNEQLRKLAADFNERGFKASWYSTCGLCVLATLREMCNMWSSEIEMSWIKSYSRAMSQVADFATDRDPAYAIQNPAINYRTSGRSRRASIPSQLMQSYNLSNLRS